VILHCRTHLPRYQRASIGVATLDLDSLLLCLVLAAAKKARGKQVVLNDVLARRDVIGIECNGFLPR
jgi:hypothetical protein